MLARTSPAPQRDVVSSVLSGAGQEGKETTPQQEIESGYTSERDRQVGEWATVGTTRKLPAALPRRIRFTIEEHKQTTLSLAQLCSPCRVNGVRFTQRTC